MWSTKHADTDQYLVALWSERQQEATDGDLERAARVDARVQEVLEHHPPVAPLHVSKTTALNCTMQRHARSLSKGSVY